MFVPPAMDLRAIDRMSLSWDKRRLILDGFEYDIEVVRAALIAHHTSEAVISIQREVA